MGPTSLAETDERVKLVSVQSRSRTVEGNIPFNRRAWLRTFIFIFFLFFFLLCLLTTSSTTNGVTSMQGWMKMFWKEARPCGAGGDNLNVPKIRNVACIMDWSAEDVEWGRSGRERKTYSRLALGNRLVVKEWAGVDVEDRTMLLK